MSGAARRQVIENEEDWEVLSPNETQIARDAQRRRSEAYGNIYLDFQLRTRFGTFSFTARPIQPHSKVAATEYDTTVHMQEQSPFFRLPVELRLQIYGYLMDFINSGPAVKLVHRRAKDHAPSSLTVLLACRRTLTEAEDIFYSINRLCLEEPAKFLSSIGQLRRSAITKILLPVGSAGSMLDMLEQLHPLPNLTSLHIQRAISVKYQDVSSWAIMAPQLVAEIEKMKKVVDFKIWTPEAGSLNEHEIVRKNKLDGIDKSLRDAVSART